MTEIPVPDSPDDNLRVLSKEDLLRKGERKVGNTPSAAMHFVTCWSCGLLFAIPLWLDKSLRENHQRFYCPHGHGNYYPESK